VSGLANGWHTLNLHIVYSNYVYYVQYYLDGRWYNSWATGGSHFDNELAPSAVIESIQTSFNDWIGYGVYGYLEGPSQTTLPTYFYGGLWGASYFECTVTQTTSLYPGSSYFGVLPVLPPTMLAVSGRVLQPSFGSTHEFDTGDLANIPNTQTLNAINVNVVSILANNYMKNACQTLQVS
jgi:hypothetical protein